MNDPLLGVKRWLWEIAWLVADYFSGSFALLNTKDVVAVLGKASGPMHFIFSNTADCGLLSELLTQIDS